MCRTFPTVLSEKKFCPTHLSEGALADERVNLVAVHPLLAGLDDVVMVVVVVAVIVEAPLLLVARILALRLLCSPLLLGVVHLWMEEN